MKISNNEIRDSRIHSFLPVSRILSARCIQHPELLIGNRDYQCNFKDFTHTERTFFSPGGTLLLDFGFEFCGGVRLICLDGGPGRFHLVFGESVSEALSHPDQTHAIHETTLDIPLCGMVDYGNTAFRFVRIDNIGDTAIELQNILGIATYLDLEPTGRFSCSDARLNQIWETARHTLLLNMQDYVYDGPKRDRAVWMGDLYPEMRGIMAAFSDYACIRKSLDLLTATTPLDRQITDLTSYTCWWVIALHDFYQRTGDRNYLESHAAYLESRLKEFSRYIDDEGRETLPERRFLDWPNEDDLLSKHAGLQGLLFWMMNCGKALLDELRLPSDYCATAARRLQQHHPDCHGRKAPAALLTLSGFGDYRDILNKNPFNDISTYFGFFTLFVQPTQSSLDLIRTYWGAMLDKGATTFWEDFDMTWVESSGRIDEITPPGKKDIHADFGKYCYKGLRHSLCHGWSCGPLPFLSERVLGIRFLEPGGRRVSIQPDLGDLEFAQGALPTPYGSISVKIEKGKMPEITLPAGVEI